jgi:hypothetical protein
MGFSQHNAQAFTCIDNCATNHIGVIEGVTTGVSHEIDYGEWHAPIII